MRIKTQAGQALAEALIVSFLLIAMLSLTMLLFAYGTFKARVELEMHEALICSLSEHPPLTKREIRGLCLTNFKAQLSTLLKGAHLLASYCVTGRDSARMTVKIRFLKHQFNMTKSIQLPLKKSS